VFALGATFITIVGRCRLSQQKRTRRALLALLAAVLSLPLQTPAQGTTSSEYRNAANVLSRIPSFVEWPADAFAAPNTPFRMCVYGSFSFGTTLSELMRTQLAHGRRVEVRWARKESDLRGCQIVFVSRSEQKNYAKILGWLHGTAALTVGETKDFAESGGMVELAYEDGVMTFEINLTPTEAAHLRISSQLLSMARRLLRTTELAKS
jgi:uncharacterized protein DUF4154